MAHETKKQLGIWGILAIGFVLGFTAAGSTWTSEPKAVAAVQRGAAKGAQEEPALRVNYFPNTEKLGEDEMRVTAL